MSYEMHISGANLNIMEIPNIFKLTTWCGNLIGVQIYAVRCSLVAPASPPESTPRRL